MLSPFLSDVEVNLANFNVVMVIVLLSQSSGMDGYIDTLSKYGMDPYPTYLIRLGSQCVVLYGNIPEWTLCSQPHI